MLMGAVLESMSPTLPVRRKRGWRKKGSFAIGEILASKGRSHKGVASRRMKGHSLAIGERVVRIRGWRVDAPIGEILASKGIVCNFGGDA